MSISKRLAAGTLAAVALAGTAGVTTASAAGAPPSPTDAEHCPGVRDGHWPAAIQGQPDLNAGDKGAFYMWHDGDGWHVRVTHRNNDEKTYTGIITTPGRIVAVDRVLNEGADTVALSADHQTMAFSFHNYGRIDGIDFRTECAPRLSVGVRGDGNLLPTNRIFLGENEVHPASDPFTVVRAS
jgi:hypothetical protein